MQRSFPLFGDLLFGFLLLVHFTKIVFKRFQFNTLGDFLAAVPEKERYYLLEFLKRLQEQFEKEDTA